MISLFDEHYIREEERASSGKAFGVIGQEILRIYPDALPDTWRIEIGPWYNGVLAHPSQNYQTKEKILLNKRGLRKLAKEIRKVVKKKSIEKRKLKVPFCANKPELFFEMEYVQRGEPFWSPELNGMFQFTPCIKNSFIHRALGREEDEIYRSGWEGMTTYISEEQLQKFVNALEAEIKGK